MVSSIFLEANLDLLQEWWMSSPGGPAQPCLIVLTGDLLSSVAF